MIWKSDILPEHVCTGCRLLVGAAAFSSKTRNWTDQGQSLLWHRRLMPSPLPERRVLNNHTHTHTFNGPLLWNWPVQLPLVSSLPLQGTSRMLSPGQLSAQLLMSTFVSHIELFHWGFGSRWQPSTEDLLLSAVIPAELLPCKDVGYPSWKCTKSYRLLQKRGCSMGRW